ncbi:hypothetical protein IV500_00050 [Paeniglutamicibacter antarcticus]|uniref:ABC-2 type transport system permease protein n=1 Tax=Arthrobacter terrae TaxID=2935737 RepID=A0A931CN33_9MICC|nr:hypothetical protein [Arthrobacter terrae]MBG0737836.1 hypothetical protein [Arthrobacter terrae]
MSALSVLLGQRLRRDRWQLVSWIGGTGLLALFSAAAVAQTYGDYAGRVSILRLAIANPAILMLRGTPRGGGLDAFVFFEIFTFLALLAGFMSTFLAVRHSRAEEESGRAEIVSATPAARMTPTVATLIHGVLASVLLGIVVALAFIAGNLDAYGSFVTGAAVASTGVAFLAVGLLAAQFMRTSRGANGTAASVVGIAYVLRGLGDALGTSGTDGTQMSPAWPSWLSPIGWGQQSAAYTANNAAPMLLSIVLAAVCLLAVFGLQARRDSGASLLAGRAGRITARSVLSGPLALGWRLQLPSIIGWCLGGAFTGLLAGTLSKLVEQAGSADPTVSKVLHDMVQGGGSMHHVLLSVMFSLIGILAATAATQTIIRMRQEEAGGGAELILASPVSRTRWFRDYLLLGLSAIVLVLLSGAVVSGLSALAVGGDPARIGDSFAAAAAQLPAALVYLGVLALLFVVLPGVTITLAWISIGAGVFFGFFGGLVGVPQWARNISPFTHTPVPSSGADFSGALWMLVIAAAAVAVALVAMRRRELRPN